MKLTKKDLERLRQRKPFTAEQEDEDPDDILEPADPPVPVLGPNARKRRRRG